MMEGFTLAGKRAVLATMHGKERVIRPLLGRATGLQIDLTPGLDTDRFGTFSREIERVGSQLDAARAKISAAFQLDTEATVGIASEGSFGPHPFLPFVALGREIVLLRDRKTSLELIGRHADLSPMYRQRTVESADAALSFAAEVGFPAHGIIVVGTGCGGPVPDRFLHKDATNTQELSAAVGRALSSCGEAHVETDMRAHRNPTRMRAIKRATIDLVRLYRSKCPDCARPGFAITERTPGLPCEWCGEATNVIRAEVMSCDGCGYRRELPAKAATAEPGLCNFCNP